MPASSRPVVVKIGGSTLGVSDTSLHDLVTLQRQGCVPVVVHGGGPAISQWMQRQGLTPRFVRGLRVTDAPSLEIVVAVLAGLINKQLVAKVMALGGRAVGISGADGGVLQARPANPELGLVGEVVGVNPEPVLELMRAGYIPVVAPVGIHLPGEAENECTLLNINGDTAAGHLAWALNAEKLVFLTDVEGVLDSSKRLISRVTAREVRGLISSGTADGGMIPKLEACMKALERVPVARILDGRVPKALLDAINGQGGGTWLTGTA